MKMTMVEQLAEVLRGGMLAPTEWRDEDVEAFCAAAEHHGVLPLVAEQLLAEGARAPAPLASRLADWIRLNAAADLEREAELRVALSALETAGVKPILFKGAHLAYADYARPDLRPRLDADVLIPADVASRQTAHDVLIGLGYATTPHVGGDMVMTQRMYVKRRGDRVQLAIDAHWRVANPQAFSRIVTHEELLRDAVPISPLGPAARGPSGPHALLIACMHRVAHHASSDCLIWLCDIDRLARRLTTAEWDRFAALVAERELRAVSRSSLSAAAQRFGTPVPGAVLETMQAKGSGAEASAAYLHPPTDSMTAALGDLRALSSWRDRARLVREHVLPPADYMRRVYAPASRAPVAWLYARRLVGGAQKWLRRRRAPAGDSGR